MSGVNPIALPEKNKRKNSKERHVNLELQNSVFLMTSNEGLFESRVRTNLGSFARIDYGDRLANP